MQWSKVNHSVAEGLPSIVAVSWFQYKKKRMSHKLSHSEKVFPHADTHVLHEACFCPHMLPIFALNSV